MKKYVIIFALLVVYLYFKNSSLNYIPSESIRFRIIPNSNNVEDIFIKEEVLNNISEEINGYETANIEEARNIINGKLENIKEKIDSTLKKYNYDKSYDLNYGYNFFPEKEYNGTVYEEGYYESLVIKLGEGKGDNFWCVLFPPLCLLEIEETEKKDIEYSFFLKEIINKIIKE